MESQEMEQKLNKEEYNKSGERERKEIYFTRDREKKERKREKGEKRKKSSA